MDCTTAHELMLEADPQDLRDGSDSELGRHLATCADCRATARRIDAAETALRRAVSGQRPRRDIARVIATARAEGAHRTALRRRWQRWMPLAAAAGLVALVWIGRRESVRVTAALPEPSGTAAVTVEAPAGRNVAVLETPNPDIVVIWFF